MDPALPKRTTMGWDAVAAIGSIGQFVVVLGAAFFGYAQLRALHRQNELQATIPSLTFSRTEGFNAGFRIVRSMIYDRNEDEDLRARILAADFNDPRVLALYNLAAFFNELGVLVQEDMIDGATIVAFFRAQIIATWELWEPFVIARRQNVALGGIFANFEALAIRAHYNSDDDRFARARRLLPAEMRAAFDASTARTRATNEKPRRTGRGFLGSA
jgi:hypothetical protein